MKHLLSIAVLLSLGFTTLLAQGGLKADYFNGTQLSRYVATNFVDNLDFYWNNEPPVEGMNPHECSVRYTGKIRSPKTGIYTFSARVDDGIRVWVGDVQVINNWQLNDVGFSEGEVEMIADESYDIKIEYFNALNEAELRLLWQLPSDEEQNWLTQWWYEEEPVIIPAQYFAPPEEVVEVELESTIEASLESTPLIQDRPKSKSKSKPSKAQPKITRVKPTIKPQKKMKVDTIQQYLPKNIAFNRAESEILPVSYPDLDKLARFLVRHPNHKVRIEGHTDNVGDTSKNYKLSTKRAYAVAAYLVKKGVDSNRLTPKGFGGTKPLVRSHEQKYQPENRRVEFIIE